MMGIALLLGGVVLFMALVSPALYFPRAGYLDEWAYLGFAERYFSDPDFFSTYYKVSRLPWILVVTSTYGLLPWQVASVLVAGLYLAAMAVLSYLLLRRFTDDLSAFGLGILFALVPMSGGSGGWAYHNTVAGPFMLLTLMATWRAFDSGRERCFAWSVLSGVLFCLTLHSNIVFVNLAPFVLCVGLAAFFETGGGNYRSRG